MGNEYNKVMRRLGCLSAFVLAACGSDGIPSIQENDSEVVYGNDDREDVYAHPDPTLVTRAMESTVALMGANAFDASNPNDVTFLGDTLGVRRNLCPDQRFIDDPTSAFCSGTLIDDDLILTAGHCVRNQADCDATRFVFRYYRDAPMSLQTVTVDDIFTCTELVAQELSVVDGRNLDYAVLRIDRPATPRHTPAPVRLDNTPLTIGDNVAVIGSGSGVPFKIDSGGSVRDARGQTLDFFEATTDTFGGNSGSGVYEMGGHTVTGILVRGEADYTQRGNCTVVNECPENGCSGEDITYVYPALAAVCTTTTSASFCAGLPPPPPPPPPNGFRFDADQTDNAQQNTVDEELILNAGDTVTLGTCGVTNAELTGDSFIRVVGGGLSRSNDDACGGQGSQISFTVDSDTAFTIQAGCSGMTACSGAVTWDIVPGYTPPPPPPFNTFTYTASVTDSAQQNTVNQDVVLMAGERLTAGTCGLPGASREGDTYLRLFEGGTEVAANDDACGGRGSLFTFTAVTGGTYQIRAGCFGDSTCSGVVAWGVEPGRPTLGTQDYSAINTGSAQRNTPRLLIRVIEGQELTVGTCGVPGASLTGDSFIRLFNHATGREVGANDDACGGLGSQIQYTAPSDGIYEVHMGCYADDPCSGTIAWQ